MLLLPTSVGRPSVVPDAARTVRWVAVLFGGGVVLQRFAVPGLEVPLLLPLVLGWLALALVRGVVENDRRRLVLWTAAVLATGATILLAPAFVAVPRISLGSWALVLVVSSTLLFRVVDRSTETFRALLGAVVRIGVVLATACLVMTGVQVLGVPYRDVLADVVPATLLLPGYVITYPYSYDSELYRANAFVGLEPSFVSFQLGLALLAALMLRRSLRTVLVLGVGLVSTASGSGIFIVVVGLAALVTWPRRHVLRRYGPPLAAAIAVLLVTPYGQNLAARIGEVADRDSSASLRAVAPYARLLPAWTADLATVVFGAGPGASQQIVSGGETGLLVPTPAKILFDYGLLGGLVLVAFLVTCYRRSPSPSFAFTLFVSLWTVQPGLTTILLIMDVVVLVSLWSPRAGPRLEDDRGTAASTGPSP